MHIPVKVVHISVLLLPQSLQLNLFHRIDARASCSFVPSANSHRCNVVVGAVRRCVRFFTFITLLTQSSSIHVLAKWGFCLPGLSSSMRWVKPWIFGLTRQRR